MAVPKVAVYFKPQCHLCEDAKQVLERVRPYHMFDLEEVNINLDTVAYGLYSDKIPVVTINGQMAFKYRVDEDRLIRRLKLAVDEMHREEEERRKQNQRRH
ncbi:MAG: glutaredoxin family protein [Armatimonadetes bacterium]|nr:glutaredoxin family protein [Armatimonadota bacterium]